MSKKKFINIGILEPYFHLKYLHSLMKICKTNETKQITLFNGDSTVDSEFQYTDENGVVQTPTVTAGVNQTVCARLSCPTPTVLSGDGIIELTIID